MLALRDVYQRRSGETLGAMDQATDMLMHPTKKSFGLITLVLLAVGFYYLFPEIRRYLRLERM